MAVKTRDEIMSQLSAVIGENNSDDVLSLMTDISDTLGDNTAAQRVTELEAELENKDKEWRQKYREAFFSKPSREEFDDDDDDKTPKTFEDLFTTK